MAVETVALGPMLLLESALKAWRQILSPPFRQILWRSLLLTVIVLGLVWYGLTRLFDFYLTAHTISGDYPILDTIAFFLVGIGLVIGLAYILPAVTALVAGCFSDDAAEIVEREHYPADPPGKAISLGRSLVYGARFAALSLAVNAVALLLIFVPGVNLVAFFAANGYLLGREYFEMAASRFRPLPDAAAMRLRFRGTIFLAGLVIAALVAVPILNLLTPLFGIAFMVHVHKALSALEEGRAQPQEIGSTALSVPEDPAR